LRCVGTRRRLLAKLHFHATLITAKRKGIALSERHNSHTETAAALCDTDRASVQPRLQS